MDYFTFLPEELYNLFVSKLDLDGFKNIISTYGKDRLNFSELFKLNFPSLILKKSITLNDYIDKLKTLYFEENSPQVINLFGDAEYVIFQTRYIDRLLEDDLYTIRKTIHIDFYNFVNDIIVIDNLENIITEIERNPKNPNIESEYPKIIFTSLRIDFKFIKYNKYDPIADEIINTFDRLGHLYTRSGTICFKLGNIDTVDIVEYLKSIRYCYGINNPLKIGTFKTLKGTKVLYLEYDTESG